MNAWVLTTLWWITVALSVSPCSGSVPDIELGPTCEYDTTDDVIAGNNGYIGFKKGDKNAKVILLAPHGGMMRPSGQRSRTHGCYHKGKCTYDRACSPKNKKKCNVKMLSDANTRDLAEKMAAELEALGNGRPHVIINYLHRSKMDANRDLDEAAQGNAVMIKAWHEFHEFIDLAKCFVEKIGGGLVLDIHGMVHTNTQIELGYLFKRRALNTDAINPNHSSIKNLAQTIDNTEFETLLRGSGSLGARLAEVGVSSMPSPQTPRPLTFSYFSGGYNIRRHGSRDGGAVDAIQVEHARVIRESHVSRATYAKLAAAAIDKYINDYYRAL